MLTDYVNMEHMKNAIDYLVEVSLLHIGAFPTKNVG